MDCLQNVLDNSADMIITTDIENNVVEFNKGSQEILGHTQSESVGKPLCGFFANPDHCNQLLDKIKLPALQIKALKSRQPGLPPLSSIRMKR